MYGRVCILCMVPNASITWFTSPALRMTWTSHKEYEQGLWTPPFPPFINPQPEQPDISYPQPDQPSINPQSNNPNPHHWQTLTPSPTRQTLTRIHDQEGWYLYRNIHVHRDSVYIRVAPTLKSFATSLEKHQHIRAGKPRNKTYLQEHQRGSRYMYTNSMRRRQCPAETARQRHVLERAHLYAHWQMCCSWCENWQVGDGSRCEASKAGEGSHGVHLWTGAYPGHSPAHRRLLNRSVLMNILQTGVWVLTHVHLWVVSGMEHSHA